MSKIFFILFPFFFFIFFILKIIITYIMYTGDNDYLIKLILEASNKENFLKSREFELLASNKIYCKPCNKFITNK